MGEHRGRGRPRWHGVGVEVVWHHAPRATVDGTGLSDRQRDAAFADGFGCVVEGLGDVLALEVGIVAEDVVDGEAGDEADDGGDGDAQVADAGDAAHLGGAAVKRALEREKKSIRDDFCLKAFSLHLEPSQH